MKKRILCFLCGIMILSSMICAQNNATHVEASNNAATVAMNSQEMAQEELPGQENVLENYPEGAKAWESDNNDKATLLTRQQEKAEELKSKDSFGGAVTLLSMGIVILCLAILAVLFMIFGAVSSYLQKQRKIKVQGAKINEDNHEADSGEVIAAIAAALAEHFSGKHDIEDTVLTIKRMKRAYSPWNSKIYNLRVAPEVRKK